MSHRAQKIPQKLDVLREKVMKGWLNINLIDIIKKADLLVIFT